MNLASQADVRTWGRNAWRTPKNVCEGGYNEWGSSFFRWPRWQHPCTIHAKSVWPALGRPTYSSFFRPFLFSHCLLNVEYETIGAQKREFLSKKCYCCPTLSQSRTPYWISVYLFQTTWPGTAKNLYWLPESFVYKRYIRLYGQSIEFDF